MKKFLNKLSNVAPPPEIIVNKGFEPNGILAGKRNDFRKKAFTLAEVLFVTGMIGIIAAFTIPSMLQDKAKSETVVKLKKEYTSLAQSVKLSEMDNGSNQYWDMGVSGDANSVRTSFDTLWAPYLNILKYCTINSDCGYKPSDFYSGMKKDGFEQLSITSPTTRTTVMLKDGTVFLVLVNKLMTIDINAGKGPNIYGKDVFWFTMDKSKGFVPLGYQNLPATATDCALNGQGQYCATKIMIDNWQIKDDYPWD